MIPKKGSLIKILFKNGGTESGYVLSWTDEKSAIKSLYSKNIFVIMNTKESVFGYKIILENEQKNPIKKPVKKPVYVDREELPTPSYTNDMSLRAKQLSELHLERMRLEKERVRDKMRTFRPPGEYGVSYGYPTKL